MSYADSPAKADWNVRQHLKPEEIIVQSHRGAGELAPENTVESFELGWKLHTYPEADVRTTSDGVIVAFHDGSFKRVVKHADAELQKKGVKDLTWDEVKKLDVGSWMGDDFKGQRVCLMEDFFRLMKGKPENHIYLDIKEVDFEKLADLVKKYGLEKQVVLATRKHEQILAWKKLIPESDTLLWVPGKTEDEQRQNYEVAKAGNFEGITQLQMHTTIKDPNTSITRETINPYVSSDAFLIECGNELRKHGILYQTLPWGGKEHGVYWKLLDLGFMSFATDHPIVTREAVQKYYQLPADSKTQ